MMVSNCPACVGGDHSRHVEMWGTRPEGIIDADVCLCRGDCKERYDQAVSRWFPGLPDDSEDVPTYLNRSFLQTLAALERRETITTDPDKKLKCCGMPRDDDGFCQHRPYHPIYVEL